MANQSTQRVVEQREKQAPKDTRRFSDGVRIHQYVGVVLKFGRDDLLRRFPDCSISQAEFSSAALPVLKRLGRVALIDPRKPLPDWLRDRERKLAKRGGMLPIWMPTEDLHIFEVWQSVVPEIRNNKLVWSGQGCSRK
jgi:hypothetical protein